MTHKIKNTLPFQAIHATQRVISTISSCERPIDSAYLAIAGLGALWIAPKAVGKWACILALAALFRKTQVSYYLKAEVDSLIEHHSVLFLDKQDHPLSEKMQNAWADAAITLMEETSTSFLRGIATYTICLLFASSSRLYSSPLLKAILVATSLIHLKNNSNLFSSLEDYNEKLASLLQEHSDVETISEKEKSADTSLENREGSQKMIVAREDHDKMDRMDRSSSTGADSKNRIEAVAPDLVAKHLATCENYLKKKEFAKAYQLSESLMQFCQKEWKVLACVGYALACHSESFSGNDRKNTMSRANSYIKEASRLFNENNCNGNNVYIVLGSIRIRSHENLQEALTFIKAAYSKRPNDELVVQEYLRILFMLGQESRKDKSFYREAIDIGKKFLKANPTSESCLNIHLELGLVYAFVFKDMDISMHHFKEVLFIDEKSVLAHVNIGDAYFGKRDYARAKQSYEKALAYGYTNAKNPNYLHSLIQECTKNLKCSSRPLTQQRSPISSHKRSLFD